MEKWGHQLQSNRHLDWDPSAWATKASGPGCLASNGERTVPLVDIWASISEGRLELIDHFVTREASHAVFKQRSRAEAHGHGLSTGQAHILSRLVSGERQKSTALELGISAAAVTLRAQRCLRRLGLDCRPASLPLFLAVAALARTIAAPHALTTTVEQDPAIPEVTRCRLARVDRVLPKVLSCAEQAVTRLLVEGRPPTIIAAHRRTSPRTVSNQLSSIFAKLRVSGRLDLIALLVTHSSSWAH